MPDRIKLTEEDFTNTLHPVEEYTHRALIIDIGNITGDQRDQLKAQILEDKEKAKKWDNASNGEKFNKCNDDKDGYCWFEKQVNDLEQENKQLKEDNGKNGTVIAQQDIKINNFKQKLDKINELFLKYTNCVMDSLEFNRQLEEIIEGK